AVPPGRVRGKTRARSRASRDRRFAACRTKRRQPQKSSHSGINAMRTLEFTVLLISQDEALCSAVRDTLEHGESPSQVASVASFAEARNIVADLSPDLIVLQESALRVAPGTLPGARPLPLADIVTALAGFAPVIILGKDGPAAGLAALIAAGAAHF